MVPTVSHVSDLLKKVAAGRLPTPGTADWFTTRAISTIGWSKEFERIKALPKRLPYSETPPEVLEAMIEKYTAKYARPGGTQKLWGSQAFGLHELATYRSLVGFVPVGGGKSLLSLLAALELGAKRPLLLVQKQLLSKLREFDYPNFSKYWLLPYLDGHELRLEDQTTTLYALTYESLSQAKSVRALFDLAPDLIIADEAHTLAPIQRSSRSSRFDDYFRQHPDTKFIPLTGTPADKKIKPPAKLTRVALGVLSPYPRDYHTTETWGWALDFDGGEATDPGVLREFARDDESVRNGFRRRVESTPGVLMSHDTPVTTALQIHEKEIYTPVEVVSILSNFRNTWTYPNGDEIVDKLAFSKAARELGCGFYYRWRWATSVSQAAKLEWIQARREWNREVRMFLHTHRDPKIDSAALYEEAVVKGVINSDAFAAWNRVRDVIKPSTTAVWFDDFLIRDAVEFGRKSPCIIWYSHKALGRKIAELGGFELFADGAKASARISHVSGNETIVASVKAHSTGKNLTMFSSQLITTPSSSAKTWEQLLGRLHRPGQKADSVQTYVYVHTPEAREAVFRAVKNAEWVQDITGGSQRILQANITFATTPLEKGS